MIVSTIDRIISVTILFEDTAWQQVSAKGFLQRLIVTEEQIQVAVEQCHINSLTLKIIIQII